MVDNDEKQTGWQRILDENQTRWMDYGSIFLLQVEDDRVGD